MTVRALPPFVLGVSVLALAAALVAQYGFDLRPCELCLIQRIPFALAGLLAGLVLALALRDPWPRRLMAVAGLAFLVNSGVAVYHVGVEQKWWASACASSEPVRVSVADLAAAMRKPAEARCDEPAWSWHGITMATLNVAFSGGLGLVVLALVRRKEPA